MERLQSELARLELSATPRAAAGEGGRAQSKENGSEISEKQRTKEKLRRIIKRCDMYVQRHQMLKEMGIY